MNTRQQKENSLYLKTAKSRMFNMVLRKPTVLHPSKKRTPIKIPNFKNTLKDMFQQKKTPSKKEKFSIQTMKKIHLSI